MSKASDELENAIATIAKIGKSLPKVIPIWMQNLGIKSGDIITNSSKIGNKSPNNKTDILIEFKDSPPLKISAKLNNADYFGNWYGHERLIREFGRLVFDKLTVETTLWANKWAKNTKAKLFVGVSVNFGKREGNTFIDFLKIFENTEDLKKIICGVGAGENVANCLYISNNHPKSLQDMINNLEPIDLNKIEELSKNIKVVFRPVNPMTEGSNRGKNVYTKFEPDQPLGKIKDITTIKDLMKLGKFTTVFPNRLNHNHILDTLQADYKIRIPLRPNPKKKWQFYSESET